MGLPSVGDVWFEEAQGLRLIKEEYGQVTESIRVSQKVS